MGQSDRVPHVLHSHVSGPRQRVAISLRGLRQRRRRLPHPLHHSADPYRQAYVLP